MTSSLPRVDIQRLALIGHDTDYCLHFILRVANAPLAVRFVQELVEQDWVKHSASLPDANQPLAGSGTKTSLSIGFTAQGLAALGMDARIGAALGQLAPAFAAGARARAARLGDTGASAAESWSKEFEHDNAHVLVSLHGDDRAALDRAVAKVRQLVPDDGGLTGWDKPLLGEQFTFDDDGARGKIRTAHFGLRDGIARPAIVDQGPGQDLHAAGELLLGYPNDVGMDRWTTTLPPEVAAFFTNGSFAAFRQMAQDEIEFASYLDAAKTKLAAQGVHVSTEYLKAKFNGRWPNGAPLLPGATEQPNVGAGDALNDFDFGADGAAHGCPFGSHIRRTNPRADSTIHRRRRPIFRRGMPYGPRFNERNADTPRGMLGLFFCASLEDQFEHVLAEWIDKVPIAPGDRGDAKDPLVGHHDDAEAVFSIPRAEGELRLRGFRPFVRTVGMAYLFYPGVGALRGFAALTKPTAAAATAATAPTAPSGAARVASPTAEVTARAAAAPSTPSAAPHTATTGTQTAPFDRYCDLVMEGGITSGILYPPAVAALAEHFRFKNIGGSSIGAFAAAVTAAAEFARRRGSLEGFRILERLPQSLAQTRDGETLLYWMFRPEPRTRRLYNIFVATLGHTSTGARIRAAVSAAFGQYSGAAWVGIGIAALLYLVALALVVVLGVRGILDGGLLRALGWLSVIGAIGAFATLALVGAALGVIVSALRDVVCGLVPNGFGLCIGGPRTKEDTGDPDPEGETAPLTVALHRLVQACAGRKLDDPPLTFADLHQAPGFPPAWLQPCGPDGSINLQIYATNLAHGRPYRFPLSESQDLGRLFFRPADLAPYFPQSVLRAMVGFSKPYAPQDPADPPPDNVPAEFLELPVERLPIVVAARLSLSFPLLVSAVPLWAIDYEPALPHRRLKRCWFSDGGLCTNFPIHLFDSFVPRWPTFGITLQTRSEVQKDQRVWLPQFHSQGRGDLRNPSDPGPEASALERLGRFLTSLWLATWRWNDMSMLRMPGVRDRVVRIFLKEHEGGINLRLKPKEILDLANTYGRPAADAFIARFVNGRGWDEQRWVRFNMLLASLRARLQAIGMAINQRHHATPLHQQVRDAEHQPPLAGDGEKAISRAEARELRMLLAALEQLELDFGAAGNTSPYPAKPQPELRQRAPT